MPKAMRLSVVRSRACTNVMSKLTPHVQAAFLGPVPLQNATSVDGGVTWLNMPLNRTYYVTAQKEGVSYPTVKFKINEGDLAYGVELYIASPPDSVTGDNSSAPGQLGLPMLK